MFNYKVVMKIVSVVITSYNRGPLLKRAVNSVLNQTYKNLEIIIVDDNSKDKETINILTELNRISPKIRVIINKENKGANYCRNLGINASMGYYYTGLDDDDYFLPHRIELFINKYNDKYAFVCDNYWIINNGIKKKRFYSKCKLSVKSLEYENKAGNQIFTTVSKIKESGLFDENLKRLQDHDMWFRMMLKYKVAVRLNSCTYVMDISHDGYRITKSIKNIEAYESFFYKHKQNISKLGCLKNINRIDFLNGNFKFNISSFFTPKLIIKKIIEWL
ncbi:MAG TPA: glucuronosyltransferase [Vibrio sp.]|nr:glucuronosyltransferase [Vibrio sp.]